MPTTFKGVCQKCGAGSFALRKRKGVWLCPCCRK